MTAQLLPFLQSLIQRGAAYYPANDPQALRLGAAEWLPGRGLLVAEFGADHQGHVHTLAADRLTTDGDMPEIDLIDASGYLGTIMPDDAITAEQIVAWADHLKTDAWREFWAQEVANAKGEA